VAHDDAAGTRVSESVEQAALRRAAEPIDWQARANREAAAILDECGASYVQAFNRDTLIGLLSIAWMQGTIFGSHETLGHAEQAFDRLRETL
jgi:hypothetical protein